MEKPRLEDFGLTEEQYSVFQKKEDEYNSACESARSRAFKAYVIFFTLFLVAGSFCIGFSALGSLALLIVGIVLYASGIAVFLPMIIKRPVFSKPQRAEYIDETRFATEIKYSDVLNEYKNYIRDMNVRYWKSLSYEDFVKELGKLFKKSGYSVKTVKPITSDKFNLMLHGDDGVHAVACDVGDKKVSGHRTSRVVSMLNHAKDVVEVIHVSVGGFMPHSDQASIDALRLYHATLRLWDLSNVLYLANSVGSLIFDEAMVEEACDTSDKGSSHWGGLYIEPEPTTIADMEPGHAVVHESLGNGVIEGVKEKTREIIVKFVDDDGLEYRKIYRVPDAFDDGTLSFS